MTARLFPYEGDRTAPIVVVCDPPSPKNFSARRTMNPGAMRLFVDYAQKVGFRRNDFVFVSPCVPIPEQAKGSDAKERDHLKANFATFAATMGLFDPVCILTLGKHAIKQVSNRAVKITKVRGQAQIYPTFPNVPVLPMTSPAQVIRLPDNLKLFETDFHMLRQLDEHDYDLSASVFTIGHVDYAWVFDLQFLLDKIESGEVRFIAVDCEATGLDWYRPEVYPICVQIGYGVGKAVAVPLLPEYWNDKRAAYEATTNKPTRLLTPRIVTKLKNQLRQIMEDDRVHKAGHNCVTGDAEVLTSDGWVRFDALQDGVDVMQADLESDELSFVTPSHVIRKRYDGLMYEWSGMHHDACYTPDHRMLSYTVSGNLRIRPAKEVASLHPNQPRVPTSGRLEGSDEVPLSWVQLLEAVRADGSVEGTYVRFRITKARKIERLRYLADVTGCDFAEQKDRFAVKGNSDALRWVCGTLGKGKNLGPWVMSLTYAVRQAWIDELRHWGGCNQLTKSGTYTVSTARKDHADWLQAVAVSCGRRINFSEVGNAKGYNANNTDAVLYQATVSDGSPVKAGTKGACEIHYSGMVYCVTVPAGAFVMRRNGKVVITGNCKIDHHYLSCVDVFPVRWSIDTMLLAFLVDENMPEKSLDECVRRWVPVMRGYCLGPDTKVLAADMSHIRAGDVSVGDTLIGFDEYGPKSKGYCRRMRTTRVTAVTHLIKPCYRIKTSLGRELVVSNNHMLLSKRAKTRGWQWRRADSLCAGHALLPFPWEDHCQGHDSRYMRRLYEDHGYVTPVYEPGLSMGFVQKRGSDADRALSILEDHGFEDWLCVSEDRRNAAVRTTMSSWLTMRALQLYRPERLIAQRPWEGEALPSRLGDQKVDYIVEKEPIGEHVVVGITTTHHTLIAEGLCSHNSDKFNAATDKSRMIDVGLAPMLTYGCGDADATYRLAKVLWPLVKQDKGQLTCYQKVMIPAMSAFMGTLEPEGMHVDTAQLAALQEALKDMEPRVYQSLIKQVPRAVKRAHLDDPRFRNKTPTEILKFSRPDFVRDILFSEPGFNLTPRVFTKSTQNLPADQRVPSTSAKDHLPYFEDHPFVGQFIHYRRLSKMRSTYVGEAPSEENNWTPSGFWKYVYNGKIHPSFLLHRTVTGRCLPKTARVITDRGVMPLGDIEAFMQKSTTPLKVLTHNNRFRDVQAFTHNGTKRLYTVTTKTGQTLRATSNHPLRTENGWVTVSALRAGMKTYLYDFIHDDQQTKARARAGRFSFYLEEITSIKPDTVEDTYDLTVADDHSFIAEGFVVHNSASVSPNAQNFPKRGRGSMKEVVKAFRRIFVAPPGWRLVEMDFSQIELRLIAWAANDSTMLQLYNEGADIHAMTAASSMGISIDDFMDLDDEVRDLKRFQAKAVGFGFMYGMWWRKFMVYAKTDYGLDYTEREAQRLRERFFDTYPRISQWHNRAKDYVHEHGFIRALHGAVRHLPNIWSPDLSVVQECERQAVNSPIQRFGSDLGLMALSRLARDAPSDLIRPIAFIHDALVCLVRDSYVDDGMAAIKFYMETNPLGEWFGLTPPLPIIADVSLGDNMADMAEIKDISAWQPDWYQPWEDDRPDDWDKSELCHMRKFYC